MKRKKRARTATKKPAKRAPISPRNEPAIVVVQLGTAVALEYRRDVDGKTYRHQFTTAAKVHRTRDGSKLIIGPVRASDYIRG